MIEVSHLTKRYGDHLAVDDLSFTIEEGQIYGFLGPNGAGKSTTMNIMTGCLAATSGQVKIGGHDIFEEPKAAKKLIGYLPEIPPVYIDQTPREYLTFVAEAKGIKGKKNVAGAVETVVKETHIESVEDKLIRHLSKGYRQRVGIAQALLGNPQVIILDEPTVGLDPFQIIEIRDLIRELGKKHTVILSSHILPEVQAICQKVLIIHKGKLVAFDNQENLQTALQGDSTIVLTVEASAEDIQAVCAELPQISHIEIIKNNPVDAGNLTDAESSMPDAESGIADAESGMADAESDKTDAENNLTAVDSTLISVDINPASADNSPASVDNTLASIDNSTPAVDDNTPASIDNNTPEVDDNTPASIDSNPAATEAIIHVPGEQITDVCRELFFAFAKRQQAILALTPQKATLEDIFIELTGADGQADSPANVQENQEDSPEVTEGKNPRRRKMKDHSSDAGGLTLSSADSDTFTNQIPSDANGKEGQE